VPSSTDTLFEPKLATARSCLPSLLKSPTATDHGFEPTLKVVGAANEPVPVLSSTETVPGVMPFATARSCFTVAVEVIDHDESGFAPALEVSIQSGKFDRTAPLDVRDSPRIMNRPDCGLLQ